MRQRAMSVIGILVTSFLLFHSGQAQAVFGFGVQGGMDRTSIAADSRTFDLKDFTSASYTRAAMENPYMISGFFFIDAIPAFDLEVAAEAALQKYQVDYTSDFVSYSEEVPWGRLSLYLTARKDIIKQPPIASVFALYVGGGIGFHYLAPMISQNFLYDNLETAETDLDPEEIITRKFKRGFHGLAGFRIKPPVFPLGIKVEGRYTLSGGGDYEQPDSFLSFYGGIFTGF